MTKAFHHCVWPSGGPELFQGPSRHERRDAAEHRQRILEVARQLFAEAGVEAVSMHQIAQAAEIGQGTLYRRYAHKGELCMDLMLEQYEQVGAEITTLLAQTSTAPALSRLESVLAKIVGLLEGQGAIGELVAGTADSQDTPCHESDRSRHRGFQATPWYRWLYALLWGLLAEAVERSELATLDVAYTADALLAVLHPAVYRFQRQDRGFSSDRILQGLRHIYIDGVQALSTPVSGADKQVGEV